MYAAYELAECNLCQERLFVKRVEGVIDAPVPPNGPPNAKVVLIGRNPGKEEIRQGRSFVGPAGQQLDRMLIAANLPRRLCWVTNVGKCFTPAEVKPSPRCLRTCAGQWLNQELAELSLNQELLIVALGDEALKYFEPEAYVGMLHGTSFFTPKPWLPSQRVEVFVSYHPSAALRSTAVKRFFLQNDAAALKASLRERGIA